MPVVISVANQKGGVGKTTTAVNVAGILAFKGNRTLVIDADPQCNATVFFLKDSVRPSKTILSIYEENKIKDPDIIQHTRVENLDIVPGGFPLASIVSEVWQRFDANRRLQEFIQNNAGEYDVVIIDCPPDIGIYTLNAFVASDYVCVPCPPERLALEGFSQLHQKVETIQGFGFSLQFLGAITTMYDGRIISQREWYNQIITLFDDKHLGVIHRSASIHETSDMGKLVMEVDRKSRPYTEHLAVTREIARRTGLKLIERD